MTQSNQALDEAKAGRTQAAVPQAMAYGQMPAQEIMNNLQIAASQLEGMEKLFGFGQAEQTQEQQELTMAMAKFAEENQITDPTNLAIIMSLLDLNFSTSSGQSEQTAAGLGYSLLNSWASRPVAPKAG